MNRQSQQLVVAGVVAFLTSGIITLAGLSAAQDMGGGGSYTQPSGGGDMGGSYTQPGGMDTYHPMDQGTPSMFQGTQGNDVGGVKMDFQKDGQDFHRGAPDFGDGTGMRHDFSGKTGAPGYDFRKMGGTKPGAEEGQWSPEKESEMRAKWGTAGKRSGFGEFETGTSGKKGIFGKDTQWPGGKHETAGNGKGDEARMKLQHKLREEEEEEEEVSEAELAEIGEGKIVAVSPKEILATLQEAAADIQDLKSDLKDATKAVTAFKADDKQFDQAVAKVEKKYGGDIEEAPAKIQEQIEVQAAELAETKEDLQENLAGVDEHVDGVKATLTTLLETIQENKGELKQASSFISKCTALLKQIGILDTKYDTLENKVDTVKIEHLGEGEHSA